MPRDVQQTLLNVLASTATADSDDIALYSLDAEPLDQAVVQEQLLPELYYRLTTITIDVPALRDRMDDLPLLAQFFVERLNRSSDQQLSGVSLQTLELFRSYNWPGNVRELRAVVEEAHATTTGPQIDIGDLPFRLRTGLDAQRIIPPRETPPLDLEAYLRDIEARGIRRVLGECRENRAKAARLLGMTRTKLYRRMEQLGISSGSEEAGEASGG